MTILWLTFACGLPLRQVHEARRQAHLDLSHSLAEGSPHRERVIAAFDSSNQALDIAAFGPCLLLSVTILLILNQWLRLKRRYNAIERDLLAHRSTVADAGQALME